MKKKLSILLAIAMLASTVMMVIPFIQLPVFAADDTVTITVGSANGSNYATIDEAFAAIKDNTTAKKFSIKLTSNITSTAVINVYAAGKTITVDGAYKDSNGKSLRYTLTTTGSSYGFDFKDGATSVTFSNIDITHNRSSILFQMRAAMNLTVSNSNIGIRYDMEFNMINALYNNSDAGSGKNPKITLSGVTVTPTALPEGTTKYVFTEIIKTGNDDYTNFVDISVSNTTFALAASTPAIRVTTGSTSDVSVKGTTFTKSGITAASGSTSTITLDSSTLDNAPTVGGNSSKTTTTDIKLINSTLKGGVYIGEYVTVNSFVVSGKNTFSGSSNFYNSSSYPITIKGNPSDGRDFIVTTSSVNSFRTHGDNGMLRFENLDIIGRTKTLIQLKSNVGNVLELEGVNIINATGEGLIAAQHSDTAPAEGEYQVHTIKVTNSNLINPGTSDTNGSAINTGNANGHYNRTTIYVEGSRIAASQPIAVTNGSTGHVVLKNTDLYVLSPSTYGISTGDPLTYDDAKDTETNSIYGNDANNTPATWAKSRVKFSGAVAIHVMGDDNFASIASAEVVGSVNVSSVKYTSGTTFYTTDDEIYNNIALAFVSNAPFAMNYVLKSDVTVYDYPVRGNGDITIDGSSEKYTLTSNQYLTTNSFDHQGSGTLTFKDIKMVMYAGGGCAYRLNNKVSKMVFSNVDATVVDTAYMAIGFNSDNGVSGTDAMKLTIKDSKIVSMEHTAIATGNGVSYNEKTSTWYKGEKTCVIDIENSTVIGCGYASRPGGAVCITDSAKTTLTVKNSALIDASGSYTGAAAINKAPTHEQAPNSASTINIDENSYIYNFKTNESVITNNYATLNTINADGSIKTPGSWDANQPFATVDGTGYYKWSDILTYVKNNIGSKDILVQLNTDAYLHEAFKVDNAEPETVHTLTFSGKAGENGERYQLETRIGNAIDIFWCNFKIENINIKHNAKGCGIRFQKPVNFTATDSGLEHTSSLEYAMVNYHFNEGSSTNVDDMTQALHTYTNVDFKGTATGSDKQFIRTGNNDFYNKIKIILDKCNVDVAGPDNTIPFIEPTGNTHLTLVIENGTSIKANRGQVITLDSATKSDITINNSTIEAKANYTIWVGNTAQTDIKIIEGSKLTSTTGIVIGLDDDSTTTKATINISKSSIITEDAGIIYAGKNATTGTYGEFDVTVDLLSTLKVNSYNQYPIRHAGNDPAKAIINIDVDGDGNAKTDENDFIADLVTSSGTTTYTNWAALIEAINNSAAGDVTVNFKKENVYVAAAVNDAVSITKSNGKVVFDGMYNGERVKFTSLYGNNMIVLKSSTGVADVTMKNINFEHYAMGSLVQMLDYNHSQYKGFAANVTFEDCDIYFAQTVNYCLINQQFNDTVNTSKITLTRVNIDGENTKSSMSNIIRTGNPTTTDDKYDNISEITLNDCNIDLFFAPQASLINVTAGTTATININGTGIGGENSIATGSPVIVVSSDKKVDINIQSANLFSDARYGVINVTNSSSTVNLAAKCSLFEAYYVENLYCSDGTTNHTDTNDDKKCDKEDCAKTIYTYHNIKGSENVDTWSLSSVDFLLNGAKLADYATDTNTHNHDGACVDTNEKDHKCDTCFCTMTDVPECIDNAAPFGICDYCGKSTCDHEWKLDPGYPATCTAPGKKDGRHCDLCGAEEVGEQIGPDTGLGHDFGGVLQGKDEAQHWLECQRDGCEEKQYADHVAQRDDGNCVTDILCDCGRIMVNGADKHVAGADDGDCTTPVACTNANCTKNAIEANTHTPGEDDNDCSTAVICGNANCKHEVIEAKAHTPGEDDGDCTTAVKCVNCEKNAIEAKTHVGVDDGDCTTAVQCTNTNCTKNAVEGKTHTSEEDDGDCTTAVKCANANCEHVMLPAATAHTPEEDDHDCTTEQRCAVCGTLIVAGKAEHAIVAENWEKDGDGHYHKCSNEGCNYADTKQAHTSSGEATETVAETCTVCGYVITPAIGHEHNDNVLKNNETHHWYECSCGQHKGEETEHEASEDTPHNCVVCGQKISDCKDESPIDHKCDICDAVLSDCKDENEDYKCDICGEDFGTPPTTTDPNGDTTTPDDPDGTTVPGDTTTPDEPDGTTVPGDTTTPDDPDGTTVPGDTTTPDDPDGTTVPGDTTTPDDPGDCVHVPEADDGDCTTPIKCSLCGEVTTAAKRHDFALAWTIDETGHWHDCQNDGCEKTDAKAAHDEETVLGTDSTCTATGLTDGKKCSICDKVLVEQTEIMKKDHTPEADDGDCTTEIKCSVCDTVTTAAKAAHTPEEDDGDCTTAIKCSICSKTAVEANTTHTYGDWVVTKEATETEKGEKKQICENCGHEIVAEIPVIIPDHTHVYETVPGKEATCTETGLTEGKKCSCGDILVAQTVIAKKAHTEQIVPGKAATCTETGLTYGKKCSVCNEVLLAQTEIAKKGHTEQIIPGKAATCTATGLTAGKKCTVCNEILVAQTEIAKKAHTPAADDGDCTTAVKCTGCSTVITEAKAEHIYGEWVITKEATETAKGEKTKTCKNCDHKVTEEIPVKEPPVTTPTVTTPVITTPVETTPADTTPADTTPADTTPNVTEPVTDTTPDDTGVVVPERNCAGCGGITIVAQLIALICAAAFIIIKKK